jgi:hypothetical protein
MSLPVCEATHPETGERCAIRHVPEAEPTHFAPEGGEWPNENWVPPAPRPTQSRRGFRAQMAAVERQAVAEQQRPVELSNPAEKTVGALRSEPHDTEEAAAYAVMPRTGTQRMAVLEAISGAEAGLTDEQVRSQTGIRYSSECARRQELEKGGWVMDSGQRRLTSSGQDAIIWVLTPEGRARLSS